NSGAVHTLIPSNQESRGECAKIAWQKAPGTKNGLLRGLALVVEVSWWSSGSFIETAGTGRGEPSRAPPSEALSDCWLPAAWALALHLFEPAIASGPAWGLCWGPASGPAPARFFASGLASAPAWPGL